MPANLEIRILRFLVLASDPCLQTVQMSQQRPRLMHRKYKSAFRNKVETWFVEVHVLLVFLKNRKYFVQDLNTYLVMYTFTGEKNLNFALT